MRRHKREPGRGQRKREGKCPKAPCHNVPTLLTPTTLLRKPILQGFVLWVAVLRLFRGQRLSLACVALAAKPAHDGKRGFLVRGAPPRLVCSRQAGGDTPNHRDVMLNDLRALQTRERGPNRCLPLSMASHAAVQRKLRPPRLPVAPPEWIMSKSLRRHWQKALCTDRG